MLTVEVELKSTEFKGLGIFAKNFIPQGTVVYRDSEFHQIFTYDQFYILPEYKKAWVRKYATFKEKDHSWYLCTDDSRFWNHSNSPNCKYFPEIGEMIAIKPICINEELTSDYREFCDECKKGNFDFEII